MDEFFVKPEKPFLCLFKDRDDSGYCYKVMTLWCEDIEEVKQCMRECPQLELVCLIEIASCREIDVETLK